jgi:hypothetical protein
MKKVGKIVTLYRDAKVFWNNLLSSGNDSSHKRFIAVGSFFVLAALAFLNQIFAMNVNESFIYTFGGLAGLQSTLSLFEKKSPKTDN